MEKLTPHKIEVVEKMMDCCNPEKMGYHKFQCLDHKDKTRIVPFTCKTNICTTCSAINNDRWGEEIKNTFPCTEYMHITFTIPEQFRDFFTIEDNEKWTRKNEMYDMAWRVISGFFKNRFNKDTKFGKHGGFHTGCIMVLHTFGRKLNYNPHMHIVIPTGGVYEHKKGKYKWKQFQTVSRDYLSIAWKRNLLEYILNNTPGFGKCTSRILDLLSLKDKTDQQKLADYEKVLGIVDKVANSEEISRWKYVLSVHYYINVSKKADYSDAVCYIARYTKRLPISETNVVDYNEENKTVTYEVKAHDEFTPVRITVDTFDFIDRVIRHIRPKNFKLIRYYGIFSNKNKPKYNPILRSLLPYDKPTPISSWRERQLYHEGEDPLICPCCKKDLHLIEKVYPDSKTGKMVHKKIQT